MEYDVLKQCWCNCVLATCSFILASTVVLGGFTEKDCVLSEWSQWSPCNATCSFGYSSMVRHIVQQPSGLFAQPCHFNRTHVRRCGQQNNGCQQFCEKTTGRCLCTTGYELASDGKRCFNINECLHSNGLGPCRQKCVDTDGSYFCECNTGFHLAADRHDCINGTTRKCSNVHIQTSVSNQDCTCKNGLFGTRCDRNPALCMVQHKSACREHELCATFVRAPGKCVTNSYQIPILLQMKYSTFVAGNTIDMVVQLFWKGILMVEH